MTDSKMRERVLDEDSNKAEAVSNEWGDTMHKSFYIEYGGDYNASLPTKHFTFNERREDNESGQMVVCKLNSVLERSMSFPALVDKKSIELGYQETEPSDGACLTMSLGAHSGNVPESKTPSISRSISMSCLHSNKEERDPKTMTFFDSMHDWQRQLLPAKTMQGPYKSNLDILKESPQHVPTRVARPPAEGRGRNHLLPRYWPRITDQELQQITAGDSNSTITPLFEKMLSVSDAGRIGRLVLPKACAEAYFPPISQPEGLPLKIQDITGKDWVFQFRFWPNNNSRMYVLEGVTPCIQSMQLQAGDTVTFSRLDPEGKLVMGYRRAPSSLTSQDKQLPLYCTSSGAPANGVDSLSSMASLAGVMAKNTSNVHIFGNSTQYNSSDTGYGWNKAEEYGSTVKESSSTLSFVSSDKKRSRQISSKSKRMSIGSEEAVEFRITWEEAQDLLRSPPNVVPSIMKIEGYDFEEYEEPPVFGKRTLFTSRNGGSSEDQWAQCDDCGKWRRVPLEVFLPSRWSCPDNVWDVERNSCIAAQEVSNEEIDVLLQHIKVLPLDDRIEGLDDPMKVTEPVTGLEALANAATNGNEKNDDSSSPPAATTKHPRHRPGCTCIVCIQPPSGKGPKHKPTCNCNVCMTVKRRFKTLMMRRKKRQSEREAENAARKKPPWVKEEVDGTKWQDGSYKLLSDSHQGSSIMTFSDIFTRTGDFALHGAPFQSDMSFSTYGSSSMGPYNEEFSVSKSHIDLNIQPQREDGTRSCGRVSMMQLLQKASYPLDVYLKMHGLTSLTFPQQMLMPPLSFHRNIIDRSHENNETHLSTVMEFERI